MTLDETIRAVPDWPIKGVIFRDITTLLNKPDAFKTACDRFYERYKDMDIDKIVGIDARGFIFGPVLAYKMGLGFVPVRKLNKLPPPTIKMEYSLEYGKDAIEMRDDAILPGEKVLIIDDLIATGGTVNATIQLVEKMGGKVVECAFLVELPDLKGRELIKGYNVFALTEFEGD